VIDPSYIKHCRVNLVNFAKPQTSRIKIYL
jgi:hypothetical protein